jgi:hypothetical protein
VPGDGALAVTDQRQPSRRGDLDPVPADFLGAIQRCIGRLDQLVGADAVVGIDGDAEARCHPAVERHQIERGDPRAQLLGD